MSTKPVKLTIQPQGKKTLARAAELLFAIRAQRLVLQKAEEKLVARLAKAVKPDTTRKLGAYEVGHIVIPAVKIQAHNRAECSVIRVAMSPAASG